MFFVYLIVERYHKIFHVCIWLLLHIRTSPF